MCLHYASTLSILYLYFASNILIRHSERSISHEYLQLPNL